VVQRVLGVVEGRHEADVGHPDQFVHTVVEVARQGETSVVQVVRRVAERVGVQVGGGAVERPQHRHRAGAVGAHARQVWVEPVAAGGVRQRGGVASGRGACVVRRGVERRDVEVHVV